MKYLHIAPVSKKGDTTDKINYRPISTLSNFSKIFKKLIFTHINSSFMKLKLLTSLASFRKSHIIQHALLKMIGTRDYLLNKGDKLEQVPWTSQQHLTR